MLSNALNDHINAFKTTFKLLLSRKLWGYFIPGLIIFFFYLIFSSVTFFTFKILEVGKFLPFVGTYFFKGINLTHNFIDGFYFLTYYFFVVTLFSPINTFLSEKVETEVNGNRFTIGFLGLMRDLLRTILIVVLAGLILVILKLFVYTTFSIFGIGFLSPYITFLITVFFTGFNSYDYALERHRVGIKDSFAFGKHYWQYMLLTGFVFYFFLSIPLVGVILAPFFYTTVGSYCYLKISERSKQVNVQQ